MVRPLVAALLLIPSLAFAQASVGTLKDRDAVTFDEIERGVYFGLSGGALFFTAPPRAVGPAAKLSPGQMAAVEVGIDLGERLSVGAFVMGTANRAGSDYRGSSGGAASGDYSAIIPGGVAKFRMVGFEDDNQVKRTWIYARGGAGFALFSPRQLLPDPDILVFGGAGVEYYTRLRHFSVGAELTGSYLVASGTLGFGVTPSIRYAF